VFLRFQLLRGLLTEEQYGEDCTLVADVLGRSKATHWQQFLETWSR
jgi:hypothetical protein